MAEEVIAPVDCDPLVARFPDQPLEAVQEVAFVEDQLRVVLPPLATLLAAALNVTVGCGVDTETVADCAAEPPVPVQVKVYFVAEVTGEVALEPVVPIDPLHPPDAVQEVALVEDQFNIDVVPFATVLGLALRLTAGAGVVTVTVADWLALPPAPVQVRL